MMRAMPRRWLAWTAVGALVLLSFALRFHQLGLHSLWSDELYSVATITQVGADKPWYAYEAKNLPDLRLADSFLTWKTAESSPPLFEALLWLWTGAFGLSEFAVRSLSGVFGALTPLLFFAGLRRPLGVVPALLGAFVFAVAPSSVAYSQEARGYALLMFLSTLASVRLVQYMLPEPGAQAAGRKGLWYSFGVDVGIFVLLSYTHYTGFILSCALVGIRFIWMLMQRQRWRKLWWFLLVPALLLPWILLNWHSIKMTNTGIFGWRDYAMADVWTMMLPQAAEYFLPGQYTLWLAGLVALAGAAWGQRAAAAGQPWFKPWLRDARMLLVLAFAATVMLQFGHGAYTAFHARVWHPRYFSAMLPLCMVSFALLFSLAGRRQWLPAGITLVVCCMSLVAVNGYYNQPSYKEDYRGASLYISQATHGKPLVVATWASNAIFFNHYLTIFMPRAGIPYDLATVNTPADVDAICHRELAPGTQVVLFQHMMHRFYFDLFLKQCAGELKMVSERQFNGLFVNIFERTALGS